MRLEAESAAWGHALGGSRTCLERIGLGDAVAWRPAPDGIAFARSGGLTAAFFSRESPTRYVARREGRATYVLTPDRSGPGGEGRDRLSSLR